MSRFSCFDTTMPEYNSIARDEHSSEKQHPQNRDTTSLFPGALRLSPSSTPPVGTTLLNTGGNALQAVDEQIIESGNVVSVIVPEGIKPGQTMLVAVPDGRGRLVSAVIPEGCFPGHNLLVNAVPPVVVTGVPVDKSNMQMVRPLHDDANDLLLLEGTDVDQTTKEQRAASTQEMELRQPTTNATPHGTETRSSSKNDRVMIQVPPGVTPGSKIRVKLSDDRIIEVVVPTGEGSKFFVLVPRKISRQNWHDSPVAYGAPMIVAPLL